ncbi:MAG: hypothetical protein O8C59_04595 [Candidatus Methanoperedens sp.]|nr:hypothetical protein [Candidatus Methanoperedens sp.]
MMGLKKERKVKQRKLLIYYTEGGGEYHYYYSKNNLVIWIALGNPDRDYQSKIIYNAVKSIGG